MISGRTTWLALVKCWGSGEFFRKFSWKNRMNFFERVTVFGASRACFLISYLLSVFCVLFIVAGASRHTECNKRDHHQHVNLGCDADRGFFLLRKRTWGGAGLNSRSVSRSRRYRRFFATSFVPAVPARPGTTPRSRDDRGRRSCESKS